MLQYLGRQDLRRLVQSLPYKRSFLRRAYPDLNWYLDQVQYNVSPAHQYGYQKLFETTEEVVSYQTDEIGVIYCAIVRSGLIIILRGFRGGNVRSTYQSSIPPSRIKIGWQGADVRVLRTDGSVLDCPPP
jgi:hypothetical protein